LAEIEPVLAYCTYLGGSLDDRATAIAMDASGYAYVAGYTQPADFPTTIDAYDGNRASPSRAAGRSTR
jgi:hypothetical protein